MGSLQAMEMASLEPNLDRALGWHLGSNHYPPVNAVFIPVAKQAIAAGVDANLNEDWDLLDEVVTMPNGIENSLGEIIEGLHLWSFVDAQLADALGEDET